MFDKSKEIEDLNELFTKGNADNGVWKQVVVLGKKWNLKVRILGNDSDVVQEYNRNKLKEMQKHINVTGGRNAELDDEAWDAVLENRSEEEALIRFIGIAKMDDTPLSLNGEEVPVEKTKENEKIYYNILVGSPAIKDFIMKESGERSNFLSNGKKN